MDPPTIPTCSLNHSNFRSCCVLSPPKDSNLGFEIDDNNERVQVAMTAANLIVLKIKKSATSYNWNSLRLF